MLQVLTVLLVFVVLALAATILRAPDEGDEGAASGVVRPAGSPFERRFPLLPLFVGLAVTLGLWQGMGLVVWIAVAVGVVAATAFAILLEFLRTRRTARFEFLLADALDLMVSTLRAGGGLVDAIQSSARESRRPLRPYLEELLDRIRLGEEPEVVLTSLEQRVPIESFRLFTLTLAAHWQGGGSLATTLSNVGRTIRDRVDVSRRIRSQAVETQVSVGGILVVTYGLAFMMWRNYPERFELFAGSELGSMFIGLSIFLQGIGLFWIARMTRIEV